MTDEPTLADDEARLAEIASALETDLIVRIPLWLQRVAHAAAPSVDEAALAAAIEVTMVDLAPALARVLHADVDSGAGSPLATVRSATAVVTQLLVERGAMVPTRGEFEARTFPDDVFDFGPAAFADIDESLLEPGLMWGAARAHVHLRRRREMS